MTTDAQRRANRRQDARRLGPLAVRLSNAQRAELERQRRDGETLQRCLLRLAGLGT
jgi:hypothetical protein